MSRMDAVRAAAKVVAVTKYLSGKESHASIEREYGAVNVNLNVLRKYLSIALVEQKCKIT